MTTHDELLAMAEQAGFFKKDAAGTPYFECWPESLERFHALAVAPYKEDAERIKLLCMEAAEDVGGWGAYASEYFQEKHGLADDIKKWQDRARSAK